jgi:putative PIN family toxin of toxin-antitoxin system
MTRAVLDTNVLVSGFTEYRHPEGTPAQVLRRWREGGYLLLISDVIRMELGRTLRKPYYAARLTSEQVREIEELLETDAKFIEISDDVVDVATHPEDDSVLATAISGQAHVIVTGDRQLQRLGTYQGVAIVSPREFLDLLERLEQEDDVVP